MTNPIKEAAEILGSQKELGDALDVDASFVSQWATGHRKVPHGYCKKIERLTKHAVTCEQLRPDIFGDPDIAA